MTFDAGRAIWIAEYYSSGGIALFVFIWWGREAVYAYWDGRYTASHRLMAGMALIALGTAISRFLWIPGHYYRGIGRDDLAVIWGQAWQPVFNACTFIAIVGYLMHIVTASMGDWQDKALIWSGFLVFHLAGLAIWWWLGGFSFEYH